LCLNEKFQFNSQVLVDTFTRLTKNHDLVPDDCIELEWKPLYLLLIDMIIPRKKNKITQAKDLENYLKLSRNASRFFKKDSCYEIIETIVPLLNIYEFDYWVINCGLLAAFLPTNKVPSPLKSDKKVLNGVYWTRPLFAIWSMGRNSSVVDSLFLDLFSRLIRDQTTRGINTNDITIEDIKKIFKIGTDSFCLPIGSGLKGSISLHSHGDALAAFNSVFKVSFSNSFARIIVYSLDPQDTLGTLIQLEKLLKILETFAHPSNSGSWSKKIVILITTITKLVHFRLVQGRFLLIKNVNQGARHWFLKN
jgi:proteasome activator subunit 4